MALVDDARRMARTPGVGCSVGHLLAELDPDSQTEVLDALAAVDVSDRATRDAIAARGWPVPGLQQLGRHRRSECGCFR